MARGAAQTDQVCQRQIAICDNSLNLVELGKMGRIHRFVTEHPINTEHLGWLESARLVRDLVQHRGRDGGGVRAEHQTRRLLSGEGVAVARRAVASRLVDLLYALVVVGREGRRGDGVCSLSAVSGIR